MLEDEVKGPRQVLACEPDSEGDVLEDDDVDRLPDDEDLD